ncbi:MAG: heme exporter protein CcmB [Xanthobacteraceae bacterium]|nr:heme exporter protein CcmB [Xanthobacteraceae bacterium]
MTRAFLAILRRDLALSFRAGGGAGIGVIFFLAVVMVVPFAIGPDQKLLSQIGPAILWSGALLASLLGLDRVFGADAEDGSLDLLSLAPLPLELVAFAKAFAHWLATGLPLAVAAPLFGLMLGVEGKASLALAAMLLIGTPAIAFLGLIGAALAASLSRAGLLIAVLIVPFTIPVLIFGTAATEAAISGTPFGTAFKLLSALLLFSLVIGPVAAAAALKIGRGT